MTMSKVKYGATTYNACDKHGLRGNEEVCSICAYKPFCDNCGEAVPSIASVCALVGSGRAYKDPHEACKKVLGSFWIKPNENRP